MADALRMKAKKRNTKTKTAAAPSRLNGHQEKECHLHQETDSNQNPSSLGPNLKSHVPCQQQQQEEEHGDNHNHKRSEYYRVLLPKNPSGCTFYFYETPEGTAAFRKFDCLADGSPCASIGLIRHRGDVFCQVHDTCLQSLTYQQARRVLKRCFRQHLVVPLVMRDCTFQRNTTRSEPTTITTTLPTTLVASGLDRNTGNTQPATRVPCSSTKPHPPMTRQRPQQQQLVPVKVQQTQSATNSSAAPNHSTTTTSSPSSSQQRPPILRDDDNNNKTRDDRDHQNHETNHTDNQQQQQQQQQRLETMKRLEAQLRQIRLRTKSRAAALYAARRRKDKLLGVLGQEPFVDRSFSSWTDDTTEWSSFLTEQEEEEQEDNDNDDNEDPVGHGSSSMYRDNNVLLLGDETVSVSSLSLPLLDQALSLTQNVVTLLLDREDDDNHCTAHDDKDDDDDQYCHTYLPDHHQHTTKKRINKTMGRVISSHPPTCIVLDEALDLTKSLCAVLNQDDKDLKETMDTMSVLMDQTSDWNCPPDAAAHPSNNSTRTTNPTKKRTGSKQEGGETPASSSASSSSSSSALSQDTTTTITSTGHDDDDDEDDDPDHTGCRKNRPRRNSRNRHEGTKTRAYQELLNHVLALKTAVAQLEQTIFLQKEPSPPSSLTANITTTTTISSTTP